jgi:hypothetical protein
MYLALKGRENRFGGTYGQPTPGDVLGEVTRGVLGLRVNGHWVRMRLAHTHIGTHVL